MISWIQKYFQQHFKLVFLLVLLAMAVPLVLVYNQSAGVGRADRRISSRPFFGYNLASESDMAPIAREAQLSSFLRQENTNPLARLGALALANQLNLPRPTATELKDYLKTIPAFANEKGEFDANAYNRFQADIRKSNQEALVRRVIEDDFRIERVATLLGGPGFVQPQDVKKQLELAETSWTLGVATVDYKAFSPTITPSDADIAKFFADFSGNYQIPPLVSVRIADFSAAAYLDKVTATEAELKAYFDANPARFAKADPKADPKQPAPAPNFESSRLQVELAYRVERAARLATKAAADFSLALDNKKLQPGTPAFEEYLVANKIKLRDLAPFSVDEPPVELGRSRDAAEAAFKLTPERPISDAIGLSTGGVVLFLDKMIPARQPELAEVKAKVTADYVEQEKRKRFVELGKAIRTQIESRLKAGDTFEKAVANSSATAATKVESKTLAPFTLRQRPQDLDYLAYSALQNLNKGAVSEMAVGADKGLIVYAADKKVPELTEANPQYKVFQTQMARANAARSSAEYLNEIIEKELAKSAPAVRK
ncbi:MAG: peptidyl-prolyl cis-trans isomerase [Nibricoccus sp.]